MDTTWGLLLISIVLGGLLVTHAVISVWLVQNLLRKVDTLEDRLMAMSEQFPHQAMIDLQREGMRAQQQVASQPQVTIPDTAPSAWMDQEA